MLTPLPPIGPTPNPELPELVDEFAGPTGKPDESVSVEDCETTTVLVALSGVVGKAEVGALAPLPLIGATPNPELPGLVVVLFDEPTGKPEERVSVTDCETITVLVALSGVVGKAELGALAPLPLIGATPNPELPGLVVVLFDEPTGKPDESVSVTE